MFLLHSSTLIKQLLPPSWRQDPWRTALLTTYLHPLFSLYRQFMRFRKETQELYNRYPQVATLEWQANVLIRKKEAELGIHTEPPSAYIADTSADPAVFFAFDVYLSGTLSQSTRVALESFFTEYRLAGTQFSIKVFN